MPNDHPVLEAWDVRKSYGTVSALDGVELEIDAGEVMALLGPNGAGKTTLVSVVAGLCRPDSGTVLVDGVSVVSAPWKARRRTGLAPQELGVYPVLSVRDNLRFFGELAGLRRRQLADRIDEVVELLDLTKVLDRPVRFLSGGHKRRVHTGVALLSRPPLLLLDEPTAGVDVATRAAVLDAVRGVAAEGAAVCYSTHYLAEVETLGCSVAILDSGRIVAHGSVADLIDTHAQSALEMSFDGPPPYVAAGRRNEVIGETVRIITDEPARDAATALRSLGPDAQRLHSIAIVRPSLESVFLALTGRRFEQDLEQDEVQRMVDVAPS